MGKEINQDRMQKNIHNLSIELQEDLRKIILEKIFLFKKRNHYGVEVKVLLKEGQNFITRVLGIEEDAVVFTDGCGHIGLISFSSIDRVHILNSHLIRMAR